MERERKRERERERGRRRGRGGRRGKGVSIHHIVNSVQLNKSYQ